jgi:hypothetical protein
MGAEFFDAVRLEHDPEKLALGLDHRKSDVSNLRKLTMVELGNTPVLLVDTGFRKRSCSTL